MHKPIRIAIAAAAFLVAVAAVPAFGRLTPRTSALPPPVIDPAVLAESATAPTAAPSIYLPPPLPERSQQEIDARAEERDPLQSRLGAAANDGSASAGLVDDDPWASVPTALPPSTEGRLRGIDVSHWNSNIRWQAVASDDITFAIAKATEGTAYEDPTYLRNRKNAKAAGIVFGAYEYASPRANTKDAIADANHYVKIAKLGPSDIVPVLDLEETGGLNKDQLRRWVDAWCEQVAAKTGVQPMIYVSPSFWEGPMRGTTDHAERGNSIWVAHWKVKDPWVPAANWFNAGWTIWQWTSNGSVNGISGRVDMNLFNGLDISTLTIASRLATAPII